MFRMLPLDALCRERRSVEIADVLTDYYGVFVQCADVHRWFETAEPGLGEPTVSGDRRWSAGTWMTWLKNRMVDSHYFERFFPSASVVTDYVVGHLHIGFIGIVETPEMLARLPEGRPAASKTARSKLGHTAEVVTPINRLAALVAPVEKRV